MGRDSSLVRLIARAANSWRIASSEPGTVLALEAHDRRLVVTGRRGDAVPDEHEAGLVLGMVLDLAREDLQARVLGALRGADRRHALADAATWLAASAVELAATAVASGRCFAIHMRDWPSGFGCDTTVVMSASLVPGFAHRLQRDREVDLALHQQLGVERERVEGDRDRALDRVLDRHEPDVDLAALDRGDHVRHVAERHRLAGGEVGLREQRLLRERAVRPEEAHPRHRREA